MLPCGEVFVDVHILTIISSQKQAILPLMTTHNDGQQKHRRTFDHVQRLRLPNQAIALDDVSSRLE